MGVNSLHKTATRQCHSCNLSPVPSACESSTLTTLSPVVMCYIVIMTLDCVCLLYTVTVSKGVFITHHWNVCCKICLRIVLRSFVHLPPGQCYSQCMVVEDDRFGRRLVMVWGRIPLLVHADIIVISNEALNVVQFWDEILHSLVQFFADAVVLALF